MENMISLQIPQEDKDAIDSAVGVLTTKLLPHLISITKEERKELPKMGDKTVAFVTKAKEYAENDSNLVPSYLNLEEFKTDYEGTETLRALLQPLEPIVNALDDTLLVSGSEAYIAALAFYNYVKNAAKSGVTGAQEAYDDLQARFPGRNYKK